MNSTRFRVLACVLLVSACSDPIPGGNTLQNTLSGTVSLGAPVAQPSVTIAAIQTNGSLGDVLATTTADANGEFTATYARTASAYTAVCAAGGVSTDLATAKPLSLASTTLCAVVDSKATTVAVTGWSTLALALAQQRVAAGAALADAVNSAKADWNQLLACSDPSRDVVGAVPRNPTGDDAAGPLDETALSGISHAALSASAVLVSERLGYSAGVRFTPLSLVAGATQDMQSDGILNGQNASGVVKIQDYAFTPDTFRGAPEGLASGLKSFVASPLNTSGIAQSDIDTFAGCISVSQSPIFGGAGDHAPPVITQVQLSPSVVVDGVETIHGPTTLRITATDGSGVSSVVATSEVLTLGANTATDRAQAIYAFDTAGAADGETVIVITATDTAGNVATQNLNVRVSNAAPAVFLDGGPTRFVSSGTFAATGTVANPSSVASLTFKINDTVVATLSSPGAAWSQSLTMTCDTAVSLQVVAMDAVGATTTLSQTVNCDAYDPEIRRQAAQYSPADSNTISTTAAGDTLVYSATGSVGTAGYDYSQTDGSGAIFNVFVNRLDYLPGEGRTEVENNLPFLAFTVSDTGGGAAHILTTPDQLTVEYRYLFNGSEVRSWTAMAAGTGVLKLPIAYQSLGTQLASLSSDVHRVQIRVTDLAGRQVVQDSYFRITPYLPPAAASACSFDIATVQVNFGFGTSPSYYYQSTNGDVGWSLATLKFPLDLPAGSLSPKPTITATGSGNASTSMRGIGVIIDSQSAPYGTGCTACISGCGGGVTSSVPPLAGNQCIPAPPPAQYQLWGGSAPIGSYATNPPGWFTQAHATKVFIGPSGTSTTSIATVQADGTLYAGVKVTSPRLALDGSNTVWPSDPSSSIYMGSQTGFKPSGGQTVSYRVRYYLTALSQQGGLTGVTLTSDNMRFPTNNLVRNSTCTGPVSRIIKNTGQWPGT